MNYSDKEKTSLNDNELYFAKVLKYIRLAWFPILLCYLEFILHIFAFKSFTLNIIWTVLFSIGLGAFFTFLTTVFPKTVNLILTFLFTSVFTLIFLAELIYFQIFQGFAHASAIKMGGQAITNFTGGLIEGILSAIIWIILLLIPIIALTVFTIWRRPSFERLSLKEYLIPLGTSVALIAGTIGVMALFFSNGPTSAYRTFLSSGNINKTMVGVENFGLNMTVINEFRSYIFPDSTENTSNLSNAEYDEKTTQIDSRVDFSALYEKADNEALKNLTAELSNIDPTSKHDYTGLCKDYNLVAICAEAFCPEFIDPTLTPTLYKLANSGFVFNNFYSTFPNTTTNGEYTFLMGLYPDLNMGKTDSSFGLSTTNYLPYCFGNAFKREGAKAYAYHNYVAEFYYRNQTHPNMGYEFFAANSGLDIEITSPSSDLDMMVESVSKYAYSGERFVAYYMTYSGHYPYGKSNAMSAKNWDAVKDLNLSDTVKGYIACNLELEYALTHLMETLEDAGVADKTMIVLTTDHFPYGLNDAQYAELAAYAGREINDNFDKQKNSFICYVPGIEPVQVDSYCSTIDILPTVLNLLGIKYDSRLLMGQDVLAPDAEHVAILADGSFITDGISYIASKMTFEYESYTKADEERANVLFESVERKFSISKEILHNDYYSFVFDTDSNSEAIDNFTANYKDVGIMIQSAVYYLVKNDIMDPISDDTFGIYKPATIIEVIDSLYRIAGRPDIDVSVVDIPFNVDDENKAAVAWAIANGILYKDKSINVPLTEQIKVSQFALLLKRAADYFGIDTSVDPTLIEEVKKTYKHIDDEIIHASIFCRNMNIISSVYGNQNYIFNVTLNKLCRDFTATSLYRMCSYYIMK